MYVCYFANFACAVWAQRLTQRSHDASLTTQRLMSLARWRWNSYGILYPEIIMKMVISFIHTNTQPLHTLHNHNREFAFVWETFRNVIIIPVLYISIANVPVLLRFYRTSCAMRFRLAGVSVRFVNSVPPGCA